MDKPYELFDHVEQVVYERFRTQDRLMHHLYDMARTRDYCKLGDLSILYVDEDEQQHYLGLGSDIVPWYKNLTKIEHRIRMVGADVLGLSEYLQFHDEAFVEYGECECFGQICYVHYWATINGSHKMHGATRLEALCRSYLVFKGG